MARARGRWLTAAAGTGAGAAGAVRLLDTRAALGFAAGLAGGVVAVPDGLAAVLPWAALVAVTGAARGLFAMASARIGAAGERHCDDEGDQRAEQDRRRYRAGDGGGGQYQ